MKLSIIQKLTELPSPEPALTVDGIIITVAAVIFLSICVALLERDVKEKRGWGNEQD